MESNFEIFLANAHSPGAKPTWRMPNGWPNLFALRDLTRYGTSLIRQKASEVNRLQKFLEGANIKLASVTTDITGVSAKAMLAELLTEKKPVAEIAELTKGRLRNKIPELRKALDGHLRPHVALF
ncbi:MAG: hypothetical protein AB1445_01315 [Bacillota bacterium]